MSSQRSGREPLVSIVIPFYQTYREYFEECVRSVQHQSYPNWELIIVDDASPELSAASVIEPFGDPRMRCIRHEVNRGQAAARNTGIAASIGVYFMPLDCDDVLDPHHVEKLVNAILDNPGANFSYADYRLFSNKGEQILRLPSRDLPALLREQWLPHPGTLMLRASWALAGGYCEDQTFRAGNEDWDFFLAVASTSGVRAVRVPEPLYGYRQHEGSISSTRFARADYRTRLVILERHRALFETHGMAAPFLAGGYRVSSLAFWAAGERGTAAQLMWRAFLASPRELLRTVLRRVHRAVDAPSVSTATF